MKRVWAVEVPEEPHDVDEVWDKDGDEWRKDGERWRMVRPNGSLGMIPMTWAELIGEYGPVSDEAPQ